VPTTPVKSDRMVFMKENIVNFLCTFKMFLEGSLNLAFSSSCRSHVCLLLTTIVRSTATLISLAETCLELTKHKGDQKSVYALVNFLKIGHDCFVPYPHDHSTNWQTNNGRSFHRILWEV